MENQQERDGASVAKADPPQPPVQRYVDTRYGEPVNTRFTRNGGVIALVYGEDGRPEEEAFTNVGDYTAWLHQTYGAPRVAQHPAEPPAPQGREFPSIVNFVRGR